MKHKKYICDCCDKEISNVRSVKGLIICNSCNLILINYGKILLGSKYETGYGLINGIKGDFLIVEFYRDKTKEEKNTDFWESRKRVKERAAMDNQPTDNWDCHGSY